ncbi:hypothetical protein AG1IA_10358 [Rhizoctonia solani AG-1 IA]|uniref:Uncharacterized protein n=1 Tax=Thanatephorus cucumeris (strain AG1-IA) TaxID=983506 RepID=L8WFW4_THACA|nr:hypothetical protein AG1IA_10358 [Rhizoctonia solani AG-1 IA]
MRFLEYNQRTGKLSSITPEEYGDIFYVTDMGDQYGTLQTRDDFIFSRHNKPLDPLVAGSERQVWLILKKGSGDNSYRHPDTINRVVYLPRRQGLPGHLTYARVTSMGMYVIHQRSSYCK